MNETAVRKRGFDIKAVVKRIFKSDNISLIIAFIVMVAVFGSMNKNYFTDRNLISVLTSASLTGLICVGEAMLLIGNHR